MINLAEHHEEEEMPNPLTLRFDADELSRAAEGPEDLRRPILIIELRKEPRETAIYKLTVNAGDQTETHEGTFEKGRNNIVTKVNAASKLIKLEETGASIPDEL